MKRRRFSVGAQGDWPMAGSPSEPVSVPAARDRHVTGTSAYEEASLGALPTSVPQESAREHANSTSGQPSPTEWDKFSDGSGDGQRSRSDSDVSVSPRLLHPYLVWLLHPHHLVKALLPMAGFLSFAHPAA